jgi:hypothetical protein
LTFVCGDARASLEARALSFCGQTERKRQRISASATPHSRICRLPRTHTLRKTSREENETSVCVAAPPQCQSLAQRESQFQQEPQRRNAARSVSLTVRVEKAKIAVIVPLT